MSKAPNYKKYPVESVEQSIFELTNITVLKQRLKYLKKKPHKNKYGIYRIKVEIERRRRAGEKFILEALQ